MIYRRRLSILLVFTFFLVINIASSGGHPDTVDGIEAFLVTENIVLKHSAKLPLSSPSVMDLKFERTLHDLLFNWRTLQGKENFEIKELSSLRGNESLWSNSIASVNGKSVDYIEGRFRIISQNTTNSHAGIVWTDAQDREFYAFLRSDSLSIWTPDRGEIFSPLPEGFSPENGKWFTLKIVPVNNTFKLFLDNTLRIRIPQTSTEYDHDQNISKVGIRSYNSIVEFEPIKVGTAGEKDLSFSRLTPIPLEPVYSLRSLLLSTISVPFYYAATLFSVSPTSTVYTLVNSIIMSLIAVVIFCFSLDIFQSRRIAFILGIIFSVCSFVWPYNTTLFPQPLQALCIFASAFFIYRASETKNNKERSYLAGLGGLLLGSSLFAHPTSVIYFPGIIVYAGISVRRYRKVLISFLTVLSIIVLLYVLINFLRFGWEGITSAGYGEYGALSSHTGWEGLLGLVVSPGSGALFFFPISVLLPLAIIHGYRERRSLLLLCLYVIFVGWIYFGTIDFSVGPVLQAPEMETAGWQGWWWGPRYFIPALPFALVVLGSLFTRLENKMILKISIVILCIAGFYVNLLGTLIWYAYGYWYGATLIFNQTYNNQTNFSTLRAMTWTPDYSPIITHTKLLNSGFIANTSINQGMVNSWPGVLGLAPCSYDLYFFCKFGFAPVAILSAVAAILAMLIMRDGKVPSGFGLISGHNLKSKMKKS